MNVLYLGNLKSNSTLILSSCKLFRIGKYGQGHSSCIMLRFSDIYSSENIFNKSLITSVSILHTSIPHRKGYTRINLFTLLFYITLLQFYKTLHHKTKITLYSVITWKKTEIVHYFCGKTPSTKF